jgi:hypothetical protein
LICQFAWGQPHFFLKIDHTLLWRHTIDVTVQDEDFGYDSVPLRGYAVPSLIAVLLPSGKIISTTFCCARRFLFVTACV